MYTTTIELVILDKAERIQRLLADDVEKATPAYLEKLLEQIAEYVPADAWPGAKRTASGHAGGKAAWSAPPDGLPERMATQLLAHGDLSKVTNEDLDAALALLTKWSKQAKKTQADGEPILSAADRTLSEMWRRGIQVPEDHPLACAVHKAEEARKGAPPTADARTFRIAKANDEEQVLYIIAIDVGTQDSQGETISAETARKAAHDYLATSRKVYWNHKEPMKSATVVESYLAPAAFTLGEEPVKIDDWIVGVHIAEKAEWNKVKTQGTGSSIGGFSIS